MKKSCLSFVYMITSIFVSGQVLKDNLILNSYSDQTIIQARESVTLTNGFYIPTGKNVLINITGFRNSISKPSVGQNYILTRIFRDSIKMQELNNTRTIGQENQMIQYFDGLGRPSQAIQLMASPTYKDIVQYFEYDRFGRETTKYLPYVRNAVGDGSFSVTAKTEQQAYYGTGNTWDPDVVKTPNPYSNIVFEDSPLNRVKEQGAPGASWQPLSSSVVGSGHTMRTEYGTNVETENESVKMWNITYNGGGIPTGATGNEKYAAGRLYKTTMKDENWVSGRGGTVDEYKDLEGHIVLKRSWENESKALDTYYVYDDFGELCYVIPPSVTAPSFTEQEADPNFDKYIYAYKYDGNRRLVEKKIPGKGWEYLIYNKNDQVVLTQDAEQRVRKEWAYARYDAFGRITSSGLYINTVKLTRAEVSALVDAATGPLWETRTGADYPAPATTFPLAGTGITIKPLIVNYYDDYTFTGAILLPSNGISKSSMVKPLQTGSKVYRTDGTQPLLKVLYYDDNGRVIQTASQNHLEGRDYVTSTYNFAGDLLTSTRLHIPKTGTSLTIVNSNEYDHVGRLVSTKEQIGAQAEVTLATNSYNEIGQLKTKYMGKLPTEAGYVDTTSYTYNERGWIKRIASKNYTQSLMYQDGGTVRQYNGNIAQQVWRFTPGGTTSTFEYGYDKLDRLTSGTSTPAGAASMSEVITYDDLGMGNIKTLKRDALAVTTYTYTGNKLTGLSGGLTGGYTYDANGNAKTDRMGMAFTYNHLNLPQTAVKTGTDVAFLYDATGQKLQKVSKIGTTTIVTTTRDYIAGIEYNNGVVDMIHNTEGYALKSGTGYVYHYHLKDHLGNVRTTLKRGASATAVDVVQRDNYYPFGKRKVVAGGNNKYLYNGKEIQGELGDQYDYGARFYDAEIGRWNGIDPMAEKYNTFSPYSYAINNPIYFVDPDGMDITNYSWGTYYTGADAGDFFRELQMKYSPTNDTYGVRLPQVNVYANQLTGSMMFGIMKSSYNAFWSGSSYTRYVAPSHSHLFGPNPYGAYMGPQNADQWETFGDVLGSTEIPIAAQLGDLISLGANVYKGSGSGVVMSAAAFLPFGSQVKLGAKTIANTSGWVKRSVFNSLDPAIQKKVMAAIENGIVAPTGKQGIIKLTATEAAQTGYQYKVKILGKGGDMRIYGNPMENGHIFFDKIMGH